MNREQKIEAIYEKIADKTLSFGCKVSGSRFKSGDKIYILRNGIDICLYTHKNGIIEKNIGIREKIVGHPVMIGDVLDFQGKVIFFNDFCVRDEICNLWKHKRKPLEEQSDECIDYIFNLLGLGQNTKN